MFYEIDFRVLWDRFWNGRDYCSWLEIIFPIFLKSPFSREDGSDAYVWVGAMVEFYGRGSCGGFFVFGVIYIKEPIEIIFFLNY